jgi:hypothetical protein
MEPRPLPNRLATSLVFLASGAVLVLEIVALRLVGPYVGVLYGPDLDAYVGGARVLTDDYAPVDSSWRADPPDKEVETRRVSACGGWRATLRATIGTWG